MGGRIREGVRGGGVEEFVKVEVEVVVELVERKKEMSRW